MSSTPPPQDPVLPPMGLGSGPSQDEKTNAMLAWFLSIVLPIIAPLIFFVISTDKPFAKRHAAMSLGLHLGASIICFVLAITIVGILLIPVVYLVVLVFVIMGGLAANKGETYDVPGIGPMIANLFKV
jgi:uncharacterized protein